MKYFLFFILIIAIIILFFYSDKKITTIRQQMLVLRKQNRELLDAASKINKKEAAYKNILLIPNAVTSRKAIIKKNTNLYIGPLDTLPILYATDVNMEVKIFDKTQNGNNSWYYVELPKDSPVNSRGWIQEKDFNSFFTSTNDVVKY